MPRETDDFAYKGLCILVKMFKNCISDFVSLFGYPKMVRINSLPAFIALFLIFVVAIVAEEVEPHSLHVSKAQGQRDLAAYAKTYSNLSQWQARAKHLKQSILRGANLDPLPAPSPLRPIFGPQREYHGYTVQNVAFESVPGFFVTGNLYMPREKTGKHAGILCPHGHFADGRFRAAHQIRCATLARMGAVVFAYDMVGRGESTQMGHQQSAALTMQILNSMRAIDFLCSLPSVDAERIGVTGASGGGTQTFLLAALDERVAASAPVVMVAANYYGGCKCESGLPIHKSPEHNTNNAEIAALCAPRPLLLVSCGADWTQHTPNIEMPYIRSIFKFYNEEQAVENAHFPKQHHDYNHTKRAAVYAFFAEHLKLDHAAVTTADGAIDESDILIETPEVLKVFTDTNPRPAHAAADTRAVLRSLKKMQDRNRKEGSVKKSAS
tara:strand:+ start:4513 stop:5829 length:1317 start_codon:yes stop_codon:yes gene_type:complete